jgi:ferritin-like metal-binding protein YciE
MAKQTGIQQLLVEELQDLYHAEKQLTRALPKVAKAASDQELSGAIREHLEVTKGHVTRLEQIFESLDLKAKAKPCLGMKGIVEEGSETIEENKDEQEDVLDVAIAGGARRVEHYEIAGYTAAMEIARELGHEEVAGMLEETLREERQADETLAAISKRILQRAASADAMGQELTDEDEGASRSKPKARTA